MSSVNVLKCISSRQASSYLLYLPIIYKVYQWRLVHLDKCWHTFTLRVPCATHSNQVCTLHPKTVFNSIQNSFRRDLHLDVIYPGCLKYYFSLITRPNLIVSLLYWNNYKDVTWSVLSFFGRRYLCALIGALHRCWWV